MKSVKIMPQIKFPQERIVDFCQRWKIKEMAFFGSVLGGEFGPESDVDIMVAFTPDADWGLFDQLRMELELSEILNRKVDLFTREAVEQNHNWIRRREILSTAEVVYAS